MGADFWIVLRWWGTLFFVGAIAFPLTKKLFSSWFDEGYFFSKAVGIATVTYLVYLVGILHLFPFTVSTVFGAMTVTFVIGGLLHVKTQPHQINSINDFIHRYKKKILVISIEEICFFIALFFWSWIKGHEPSIHGLEKFMDYGFMKSILNSRYFPAPDMWYTGFSINYYYFGHTVVAVLTKLSGLDLDYTFNLMLASIFAFTLTMSFSIGKQICQIGRIRQIGQITGGFLTAFLVTLAGNMQTIYAFTKGYVGEDVKPFWQLLWPLGELWARLPEGFERYWYANATRFIPFTIHEFPSYSFVVSDVHGHVLSLPFTLLAIALLIQFFVHRKSYSVLLFYGLLVAVLLMTNALDGPIYLGLFILLFFITNWSNLTPIKSGLTHWTDWGRVVVVTAVAVLASIPFMSHFSSFVSGLAVNCPPAFLFGRKIGPILFETVDKCQHSPLWMLWLLWGFFVYCGGWLILNTKKTHIEKLLLIFFVFSLALIIFPEFFYFKDIYPAHFRSNTMFKLGYQAYILFSFVSGYTIVRTIVEGKRRLFIALLLPQLFLVLIFPLFSVRSYFDRLRTYKGLDGMAWFKESYPDDYNAIKWLNTQGATTSGNPVIVEADGDSYTDYARFSVFTGYPTVIGWAVHEWLWRGTYDVVAPRREEVRAIYESDDGDKIREILKKYNVRYIVVGVLERRKYPSLELQRFDVVGTRVFAQGETAIYAVNPASL